MADTSIPVIDLSDPDRLSNAKKLTRIFETVGFVYLDNVPGYGKEEEEKLLRVTKWFFSLPLEKKLHCSSKNWNSEASGTYRGYVPINIEKGHLREQYEMGEKLPEDDPDVLSGNPIYEPTPWPVEDGSDLSYYKVIEAHHKAMLSAGMDFLRLLCLGCGLPEDTFDQRFLPKSVSSLRVMHYPTYGETESPTFTCEEHTDTVFVTLLATFGYEGLEIQKENNTWVPVAPRAGSLIVNIGDLLQRVTSNRFKATRHRVRDIRRERFSVPFFFEPRFDAKFEFPLEGSSITYGPWVIERVRRFEYQYGHVPEYPALKLS